MKTLLFIFIFSLSLNADSMYQGRCVNNIIGLNTTSYRIYYSNGATATSTSQTILSQIMDNFGKFEFNPLTNQCLMTSFAANPNQYLLSSLVGIFIGFTILFFSVFLTIKIGGRK